MKKMSERRGSARQKSFLRGCVYFNKRRGAVDCLIRDISNQGARIIFSETVSIPDMVELYIPQKEQTVRAKVQWRHGDEIGLSYAGRDASVPATIELAARVDALEAEIHSLRRMLERLKNEVGRGRDEDAA
jgi:hypothetical protein